MGGRDRVAGAFLNEYDSHMTEVENLTVRILQEIRDQIVTLNRDLNGRIDALQKEMHGVKESVDTMTDKLSGWRVETHKIRLRALESAVFRTAGPKRKK